MKEPNLNRWYAVGYRRFNQWARRQYFKINTTARMRLWRERMYLVHAEDTESNMVRLRAINWTLGSASPYRFTPNQSKELSEIARRITAKIKAES